MSEETTLGDFEEAADGSSRRDGDSSDTLEQEQFGPFTLSTPGEWTAKRLGDIKQFITRGRQPTYADEGIPVINQECIYWDDWYFENLRYLDEEVAAEWKEKYFPQQGDVILNSTGKGTLGRAQVYPDNERRAIDSHVTLIRANGELNPFFYRYFLESHLGQALLYSMCVNGSTGQIELSKTQLDLLPVPLPPLGEQRKIASVLHTLDRAIQKTEAVINQANTLKSGVVQQVFRNGTASHDSYEEAKSGAYPKQWNVVRFEELIEDTRYGTNNRSNSDGEGYPTLRIPNVVDKRLTLDDLKHTPLSDDELDRLRLEEDDILVIRTNGNPDYVGQCVTFPDMDEDYVYASYLIRIRVDTDRVLPAYVREFLNSTRGRSEMSGWIRSSAGNYNLSVSSMEKFQIPLPPIEEQAEMVEKIESVEQVAEKNRQSLSQLNSLKRGLMQDLLTGEVRTADTEIDIHDEVKDNEPA
jgi:type I restriction enzyme S subunit